MPVYEYNCRRCGVTFEVRQKFSDAELELHEGCGGELEKLISAAAIQFKGSGWYVNDYGRGSSGNSSSKDGESAKSESKKDPKQDSKKDSKPAAKSDSK
jgi:putative FmdB family regulatory protein